MHQKKWESRLKVVPEAQRFKLAGIDPELEVKLDEMFKGIVATAEEIEEENAIDDVHMLRQVGCDKNNESPGIQIDPTQHVQEKRKSTETTHFKSGKRKTLKQTGGAVKLSMQIDKLCSATDNIINATSILTPAMDPFGIPKAVKIHGEMLEEIPEESDLYYFALELITNKDKRTVFLSIPPRVKVWWLKKGMQESLKLSSLLGP
ncbi:hypothetical protein V6N11_043959 [Hibiscus sabdariffa]|uniref:Uncharacterized protein n=1 Tax=Hibiscus sabdariffa TaxID=183260 RepID=A0ABR2RDY5_9ROSI